MPQVINTVTKASPTDNYPVVKDTDLSGSYRIVANITERDAIVSTQRKQSMLVFVISDLHFYQLQANLLTWTDLGLSLGGGLSNPVCDIQMQKTTIPNTLGVPVNFVRTNFGGEVDVITAGVTEIARDDYGGSIFNIAVEGFAGVLSPKNTRWNSVYTDPINNGHSNIQNVTTRTYGTFRQALNNNIDLNVLATPLVMKDLITGKYYLFTFTQYVISPTPPPAFGFLDTSTYPPVNGTIVTTGTRIYTYNLGLDQWTNIDAGSFTDLNDCIANDPNAEVIPDYSFGFTAPADGSSYNSVVTSVSPVQAGFAFDDPTLIGGVGEDGGGFDYTRTEVVLGGPGCTGRITFDDGSWMDTVPSSIPIARYVYLVQDASDAARMGGTLSNTYTTFQTAYNAANALQLSLGGTNVVVLKVGNTTAATVGNLLLTANYNQYVYIIGESKVSSIVGTITSVIAGVGIPNRIVLDQITMGSFNFNNAPVIIQGGGIFFIASLFTAGGNVTINANDNGFINIINTSGIAGVASGGIIAVNNTVFGCTAVQANSVAANIGNVSFNSNRYVSINSVQMSITGSTLGTETIGGFSMQNNLFAELPNGVTMNTNHLSPVATWGGVQITNLGRTSLGAVAINYTNAVGAPASNLIISQFFLQRVDGFEVGINWQVNAIIPKGGSVTNLSIIDSSFNFRIRIGYNPITARTNLNVNFDNVRMTAAIALRDLIFYHSLCSFAQLQLINSFSTSASGFTINNISTTSTQMTLTNQFIVRNNITDILSITSRNAGATSTVTDLVMNGNQVNTLYVEVAQGDMNFSMDQCTSKITRLVASGAATSIKRNVITNSDLNTTIGNITLQGAAPRPKLSLRNSYLNIYTTIAAAGTIDLEAYASFVDTIADVGSVSVYIGNVYTTTIKRLVTDNVAGLTFNASFDQPV